MVDLAKIRRKAKKGQAAEPPAMAPAEAPAPPAPATTPVSSPSKADAPAKGPDGPAPAAPAETPAAQPRTNAPNKLDAFKEQAGRRRSAEAAKVETQEEAKLELLTFVIAGEQYAVDIERIVEIVTPRPVTRIPNADRSIVGIISLRGTIITLVDVRRKLRHPPVGEASADTRVVVIDFHNETIGFVVDRVLRVVKAAASEIETHPVVHATELDESIRGVFRAAGALTILLDLDKLLDHRWI